MSRDEDITYSFLESDRIWPPYIAANRSHPFVKALIEVLKRLPDDDYYTVEDHISFVVEDSHGIAVNVPFERRYPPGPSNENGLTVRFDTIVIFHTAFNYSHNALIAIIAHEIAHSIVSQPNYKDDEHEADLLVQRWGFSEELEALRAEQSPR